MPDNRGMNKAEPHSVYERFWKYVDKRDKAECWPWKGSRSNTGYGVLGVSRYPQAPRMYLAHRMSIELQGIDVPEGWVVMHKCDNPGCVNPWHLDIGSYGDNVRDMHTKGRWKKLKQNVVPHDPVTGKFTRI